MQGTTTPIEFFAWSVFMGLKAENGVAIARKNLVTHKPVRKREKSLPKLMSERKRKLFLEQRKEKDLFGLWHLQVYQVLVANVKFKKLFSCNG